jgi:UDP-N-acetylmuramoyl-L-alanyl-D-glutamate--2,6-diaminopimelate ligase
VTVDLATLLRGVGPVTISGGAAPQDVPVAEVRDDSRLVKAGDMFVSVPGVALDGKRTPADPRHVADAAARGATVLVSEGAPPAGFPGVVVTVPEGRRALGIIAANRFANDALSLFAVTGTNGKTTITYLLEGILRAAGRTPGVIGTVEARSSAPGFATRPATQTTPGALALHAVMAEMRAAGTTDVALEATSHALDQDRLAGCRFRVAGLTNITQDHLDYHATMDHYFDAKAILFERLLDPVRGVGVTFVDQEEGQRMRVRVAGRALGVSREALVPGADVVVGKRHLGEDGLRATFETPVGKLEIVSPLVGDYNLANVAIAVGMAVAADVPGEAIVRGLAGVAGVPGRLERVANARDVLCVVDYAHTPDALERAIAALRPLVRKGGRLVVVFGCGGDRDPGKRPLMGAIAARDADLAVVTSDNPRTEPPEAIVDQIVAGMRTSTARPFHREVDRRAAIRFAAAQSRPGDVLLIAGKGHEDYQIVGKTKSHFDDREEAAAAFEALA